MKLYKCLPLSVRTRLFEKKLMDRPLLLCNNETYRTLLNQAFGTFLTDDERKDKALIADLTFDTVKCWLKYKALPYEYFLYDMRHSNDNKRSTFMTDTLKEEACARYLGVDLFLKDIKDKYAFYQIMKPFFGRKVFQLKTDISEETFVPFAVETKSLFCKLANGSRGANAFAIEVLDEENAKKLFSQLKENQDDEWVVEECIVQCDEMAKWNASCVNTVRLPAFMTKSGFRVLDPFFRTGRKGSVVDNAGQGGVFAAIDPETGVLITDGVDEMGHHYVSHPDSGLIFKGWQIPRWKELLDTAEKAHRTISHQKYIGWDFALTEKGWVLIEGNWGQMVGQYATKVGVKDLFMKYLTD